MADRVLFVDFDGTKLSACPEGYVHWRNTLDHAGDDLYQYCAAEFESVVFLELDGFVSGGQYEFWRVFKQIGKPCWVLRSGALETITDAFELPSSTWTGRFGRFITTNFSYSLFDKADPRLLRRFALYHEENPHVYARFKEYVHRIRLTGREKYSAWVVIQVIRWEHDVASRGEVFKINNDFIALYARMLIAEYPEFETFLELRSMRSVRKLSVLDAEKQASGQTPYHGP